MQTPTPPALPARDRARFVVAYVRVLGPWIARDALVTVLVLALATVSAYYLTGWALAIGWPPALAWTLFVALDAAGLLALVVHRHARTLAARASAMRLAIGAVALSVAGNSAAHAAQQGWIDLSDSTTVLIAAVATGAVYPVMLVWAADVAGGMDSRPAAPTAAALYPAPAEQVSAPVVRRARRTPAPSPAPASPPPAGEGAPVVVDAPPAAPAAASPSRQALAKWALEHRQPNGAPAGKKAIRAAHPAITAHESLKANELARELAAADGPAGLRIVESA